MKKYSNEQQNIEKLSSKLFYEYLQSNPRFKRWFYEKLLNLLCKLKVNNEYTQLFAFWQIMKYAYK